MKHHVLKRPFIMLSLLLFMPVAFGLTVDSLVADLASADNGPRQARARQLLPLRGPEVAWKMLPLLEEERDLVSFAALRVLEDVIHESVGRGKREERDSVANAVFSLVTPDASDVRKHIGLRLLPYVATDEHSLVHVAALLNDTIFRERALASLVSIGTETACAHLCNAVFNVEEAFKVDILRALVAFPPGEQTGRLMPLLANASPTVQAVTLRALASSGVPALLPHGRRICQNASPEDAFDAWDGYLRLLDALSARGGHWDLVTRSLLEILKTAPTPLAKSGAITGLGRHGDDTVVPVIFHAIQGGEGASLEPAALEAFRALQGRAAHRAIVAHIHDASDTMRVGLLSLLGESAEEGAVALLAEHVMDANPEIRRVARVALRKSGASAAAPVFQSILEEASGKADAYAAERTESLDALQELARTLEFAGDLDAAGRAWLSVYHHAHEEAVRESALEGVRRHPVPEAFELVLRFLSTGDMDSLPVDTMIGIALNAIQAGKEEGQALLDEIMPQLTTADAIRRAVHAMRAQGPNPEFARQVGYINRWRFAGPFPWNPGDGFEGNFFGEPEVDLDAIYAVDDRNMQWHVIESEDAAAVFDLSSVIANRDNAAAFAYARIDVTGGGPAQARLGSDDGVRLWVNKELVFELDVDRGYDIDQNIVDIELKPGNNELLAMISQRMGGWTFCLRLTHPDGRPLEFDILD